IDITKKGDVSTRTKKVQKGDAVQQIEVFDPKDPINKDSALVWHYGEPVAKKEWRQPNRNYVFGRTLSTAAIHDGLVYIAELAGYLHCLDAKTGEQYWVHNVRSPIWCSPYWVDGKVYQGSDGGGIDRNMVNLVDKNPPTDWNAEEGKFKNIKWTAELGTLSYGGVVVYDGRVFVGTNNGHPRDPKVKARDLAVLMCFAEKDGKF